MNFRFDYSRTMMMKIGIGLPDNCGNCKLFNTFEQVLEKIRIADNLTLGAPKIVYLVGWQYNGHDDKYPAFFEVNEAAKRPQDATATDSLLWLMKEAKKYNTTVSLHINLSDAYPDSPLWDTYLEKNLILLNKWGKPKCTGAWNGNKAYQVRFAEEYKSGYFQKRVNQLLSLLPVEEAGTVHVDAFFVRKGKNTSITEEKNYRRKMVEYFDRKGIDVTSEFIYREWKSGYRALWGKSDMIGVIPAVWNLRMTQKDYLRYPPQILAGGCLNMNLQWDKNLQYLFYGNMQGEPLFQMEGDWTTAFTQAFSLESVPYFFLNNHRLLKISGKGKKRVASFSEGVETAILGQTIQQNKNLLKENKTLCLPIHWLENSYYAWSEKACTKTFPIEGKLAEMYQVNKEGALFLKKVPIQNNLAMLDFAPGQAYLIKVVEK